MRDLVKEDPEAWLKRLAKSENNNLRKQALINSSSDDVGLEKLGMVIATTNENKMGLATRRVEKLNIVEGNLETIWCLYEIFLL